MKIHNIMRIMMVVLMLIAVVSASANCGTTDYSGSSGRLYDMVTYVFAISSLLVQLVYALAAILAIYSATGIYIKMQAGEEGFTKSIIVLVGSCLFLIGATIVMPAFFGVTYAGTRY